MATAVRNGALATALLGNPGAASIGAVPSGHTWLLKSIYVTNRNASAATVTIEIHSNPYTPIVAVLQIASGAGSSWNGWIAMNQLNELWVIPSVGQVHVWASGAELPGGVR